MMHEIKIKECYANNILVGKKKFEVRFNDRDYQVGDMLKFTVINAEATHSLNNIKFKIIYIHTGLGMTEDYVILGIEPCEKDALQEYKEIQNDKS